MGDFGYYLTTYSFSSLSLFRILQYGKISEVLIFRGHYWLFSFGH